MQFSILDKETAGLVLLGLAEVPQVMSAFLPSPTTAFQGGADPERVKWLRRGEIIGSSVSLSIATAISLLVRNWWVLVGAALVLGIFLLEYERAIRMGQEKADGNTSRF